jgi:hypothetical protein
MSCLLYPLSYIAMVVKASSRAVHTAAALQRASVVVPTAADTKTSAQTSVSTNARALIKILQ